MPDRIPAATMARFRTEAAERNVPTAEVERWIRAVRPSAFLRQDGAGPAVGQLGGHPVLPVGVPAPDVPFVASVDCAALPLAATDLPLPADGHLLFFGDASFVAYGRVMPDLVRYIPAGTAVAERHVERSGYTVYPRRQLNDIGLDLSVPDWQELDELYPDHSDMLQAAWRTAHGGTSGLGWPVQIGGYPSITQWDPVDAARDEFAKQAGVAPDSLRDEVVLLATWLCGEDVPELDQGEFNWVIRREDLAALRFDRVYIYVTML